MSQIPMLDPDMSGKLEGEGQSGQNQERVSGKIEEKDMLNCPVTLNKTDTDFVEKWSQQISSKLLQGWMLLDEVCVRSAGGCRGDLPLVKDLAGQVRSSVFFVSATSITHRHPHTQTNTSILFIVCTPCSFCGTHHLAVQCFSQLSFCPRNFA